MSPKSRHGKGKHLAQSKRRKGGRQLDLARQPSAVAARPQPVAPPVKLPRPGVSAPVTKSPSVSYPYVAAELKRIGILSGVILVILVVLALVLS